jgi:xanthine dehydrogenase/oxidase
VQSSKGIGEPPLFLGSTVFFALREAVRAARIENGADMKLNEGDGDAGERVERNELRKGVRMWGMDSPATAERLRLAIGDELSRKAEINAEDGERAFFVGVA